MRLTTTQQQILENVKMNRQKFSGKILSFFVTILLFILLGGFTGRATYAQSGAAPTASERGFSPAKSYAISDIETISMQSGNLMLNMPLGSLPSGRGGMSASVGLNYNSKLYEQLRQTFAEEEPRELFTMRTSKDGGWRYNYSYRIEEELKMGFDFCGVDNSDPYPVKIFIVLPDGGKHQLFLGGGRSNGEYLNVHADGQGECDGTTITTGPISFFTKDGTFLRVDVQLDGDTNWENNPWTLYMPDGSRVERYAPNPQANSQTTHRIYDRNSNYFDIIETTADTGYNNHKTTYLKDQLDRKVVIEYDAGSDPNVDEDWVHSKGVDGTSVKTRVLWKTTGVSKTYNGCGYNGPPGCLTKSLNKSFKMVDKIYLPAQAGNPSSDTDLYYDFNYNTDSSPTTGGWGEVSRVTLPSGAYADYEWGADGSNGITVGAVLRNRPVKKILTYLKEYDESSTPTTEIWTYSATYLIGASYDYQVGTSTVTGPDGGVTTEHYAVASPAPVYAYSDDEVWKKVTPDGTIVEKYYQNNVIDDWYTILLANRFVKYEFVTITDNAGTPAKTAIKEYSQDKNGNTTEVKEYDYVSYSSIPRDSSGRPAGLPSGISSLLKRKNVTTYYNDTPDSTSTTYNDPDSYYLGSSPRLVRLAKSSEVQNASGTPQSRSELTYDYTSYSTNTKGGNVTITKLWDSTKGSVSNSQAVISTTAVYDDYGNPTQMTDANGVQTTVTYGCIDGQATCPSSPWLKDLYPTKTEVASNYSVVKRTSTSVYDFYTGLVTSTKDVDNNVTAATEYDDLGRPVKVAAAVDTALEVWTQTVYDDLYRKVIVKSDLETKGDAKKIGVQHYDQLGRIRLSRTIEHPDTEDPHNEQHGIKVQTRYAPNGTCTYNSSKTCSFQLTSNPYRANYSLNASSEATMGWTRSQTQNSGKRSEVETFAGATLPYPFLISGDNTNSTGVVKTDMDVDRVLVTDQAGKQRISKTNALGWLTDVWEITASDSATESVSFPNQSLSAGYKTSYVYDLLNNLTTVTQGGQTRSFSYSTLSRLLSANNPESGTISYVYDNNGNLTGKTDARGVTTSYIYDALNRVTNRSYSAPQNLPNYQAAPNVTYTYDNVTNAKGRLTKVSSSVSETRYTSFDLLGRVTASEQRIPFSDTETVATATPRVSTYVYNLSGALIEETYPSGRVVKTVLDASGDLSMVQSKKSSNYGFWNYAGNFTYTVSGAVSSMQLGNFKWESTQFNSRLQPVQIALGSTKSATNILKLDYSYGSNNNNGDVLSQTITVPGETRNGTTYNAFTAAQTYTYDSLNRIKDATEVVNGGSTPEWKQTFVYDRFGNRAFDEGGSAGNYLTTTLTRGCPTSTYNPNGICDKKKFNPTISASNNRIVQDQDGDSQDDYQFDSTGATKKDATGNIYFYDGENKQTEVKNSANQTIGQYWYDGDGKRVKKYVPATGETTIFIYDATGNLVAEYSTIVASQQDAKVNYTTTDQLGSPRVNTDQYGAVTSRHDYRPFGEEISRTSYGADDVRKQFTSYERDDESGLDFAQARMYSNQLGRFTTTDPILMDSSRKYNPQEINLYVYVKNNPLSSIDPSGEKVEASGDSLKYYNDYKRFVSELPDSNPNKAALLATLKQLEESEVTYVINVTSNISGAGNHTEGRTEPDKEGDKIMVNIRNLGNNKEMWSLNSRIGHELEHARQFDAGEIGFSRKKDGTWVADGVDTEDEVKAYKVSAAIAETNNLDSTNKNLKRILSGFQDAGDNKEKQLKAVSEYLGIDKDKVIRQTNVQKADDEPKGLVRRHSKEFPVQRIWCNGGCNKRPIF